MKFCIHCGKELPDQAAYCLFCGAAQEEAPAGAGADKVPPAAPVSGGMPRGLGEIGAATLLAMVLPLLCLWASLRLFYGSYAAAFLTKGYEDWYAVLEPALQLAAQRSMAVPLVCGAALCLASGKGPVWNSLPRLFVITGLGLAAQFYLLAATEVSADTFGDLYFTMNGVLLYVMFPSPPPPFSRGASATPCGGSRAARRTAGCSASRRCTPPARCWGAGSVWSWKKPRPCPSTAAR